MASDLDVPTSYSDTRIRQEPASVDVPLRRRSAPQDGVSGFGGRLKGFARRREYLGIDRVVLLMVTLPITMAVVARLHWGVFLSEDTRFYITMALRDKGVHISDAIRIAHGLNPDVDLTSDYFDSHNPLWRMVQVRLMYPLLSAPFVALLGVPTGMFVIPGAAVIVTVVAGARIAQRLHGRIPALAAGLTLAAAGPMTALIAALTDAPAIGLVALIMLNLPFGRRCRGRNLVWLATLTVMVNLTRQEWPMLCGLVFGGWLWAWLFPAEGERRRLLNAWLAPAIVVIVTCGAVVVASAVLVPYDATQQFLDQAGYPSLHSAFHHLPTILWHIMRPELALLFRTDPFLAIVLFAPLVLMLIRFKDQAVGMYLGAVLGTLVLCTANGVPSLLRYESILCPVAVIGLSALVHRLLDPADQKQEAGDPAAVPALAARPVSKRSERIKTAALAAFCATALIVGIIWSTRHGTASIDG